VPPSGASVRSVSGNCRYAPLLNVVHGSNPPLGVELEREVDVRFAVQQVPQIHSCAFQVHRVDLEVTPIERAVGVVVIDLAGAAWVFGTLNRQCDAACRPEFVTSVLLVRRQPAAD